MPAVLHEREMVLPKEHADTIRNLGKNGGSGAAHGPVIIQALDARSFADFAKRNPAGFATAVGHARRMGHLRQ
jgi:hypothetical protein